MEVKYFKNINTIEELKKEYKKLARMYHHDLNKALDGTEFKEINNEYEHMFNNIKSGNSAEAKKVTEEKPEEFTTIINTLIKYNDLIIDVIGSWIWVYGNTYPIKDIIKELGFRWASAKKKWYYTKSKSYKNYHMNYDKIKNMYGCDTYETEKVKKICG